MKIAITSDVPRTGKSTTAMLLGHIFSRTQEKRVAIFSTGDIEELIELTEPRGSFSSLNSTAVLNALLKNNSLNGEELYDYAIRSGEDDVHLFNVFDRTMSLEDAEEILTNTINIVNQSTYMTLIDICGDPKSALNQTIMRDADVILNIFNHDLKSIHAAKESMVALSKKEMKTEKNVKDYSREIAFKTCYVCGKYDRNVLSEKKVAGVLGVTARNITVVPYTSSLQSMCLQGAIHKSSSYIVEGHPAFVEYRIKLLEIMQVLYDSGSRKVIRGVSEWHR